MSARPNISTDIAIDLAIPIDSHLDERKDQKTLERLRAERQAKIDELKEKTNYYTTHQLIQAAHSADGNTPAASVLACKLAANTGLKVYLGDESKLNAPIGKSNDVEIVQSTGLRNRKQARSGSADSIVLDHSKGEMLRVVQLEGSSMNQHQQMIIEHYNPTGLSTQDEGWLGRIAAFLVGEDPTQSYVVICGSCHTHNDKT
ncbi:putative vacuolar protein sorting-associated protein 45 -like protein [Capsicum annuum]|nr:putative vacuolar protein sorting-associated protein 45 -like protein [Capsicum annuum]